MKLFFFVNKDDRRLTIGGKSMDQQQRTRLIEHQTRAFMTGTVENINEQWVFFDEETDEAMMLEQYTLQEVEIYYKHQWLKGILKDDGKIRLPNTTLFLLDQMKLRIRKQIIYALEQLLNELNDEAFLYFINNLNLLGFSIFDCIYCHNYLSYLDDEENRNGVNFIVFDDSESICAIQHHFKYHKEQEDRFEFTLSTGKRIIVEKVSKI
jgi:hypothetical protein